MTALAFERPRLPRPPEDLPLSFGLALAMHGLLVAGLFLAVQWRTQPAAPVVAELWAALPAASSPAPAPEPIVAPPPPPPPAPEPEPAREPDIALDAPKKAPPKVAPPVEKKPEPVKEPKKVEPKKAEAKKAEPKKTEPRKEEPKKADTRPPEPGPRTDMERLMAQAAGTPGGATAPTAASGVRGTDAGYSARVIGCIQPHIVFTVPPGTSTSVFAEFRVELLPDASVAAVKLLRASGLPGYDAAAERAIRRCDPFPRKRDGSIDRVIDVRMQPVEAR
jgi:colicin import membrane protein